MASLLSSVKYAADPENSGSADPLLGASRIVGMFATLSVQLGAVPTQPWLGGGEFAVPPTFVTLPVPGEFVVAPRFVTPPVPGEFVVAPRFVTPPVPGELVVPPRSAMASVLFRPRTAFRHHPLAEDIAGHGAHALAGDLRSVGRPEQIFHIRAGRTREHRKTQDA
jgi:hypothetical protein